MIKSEHKLSDYQLRDGELPILATFIVSKYPSSSVVSESLIGLAGQIAAWGLSPERLMEHLFGLFSDADHPALLTHLNNLRPFLRDHALDIQAMLASKSNTMDALRAVISGERRFESLMISIKGMERHPKLSLIPRDELQRYYTYRGMKIATIPVVKPFGSLRRKDFLCKAELRFSLLSIYYAKHSGAEIIDFAKTKLVMSNTEVFIQSAAMGRTDYLDHLASLMTRDEMDAMVSKNYYAAFSRAARNGCLSVFMWLEVSLKHHLNEVIRDRDFAVISFAAEKGHRAILNWFAKTFPGSVQVLIRSGHFDLFWTAIRTGQLAIAEWVVQSSTHDAFNMKRYLDKDYLVYAIESGHLKALEWVESLMPGVLRVITSNATLCNHSVSMALANGHLNMLHWRLSNELTQLSAIVTVGNEHIRKTVCEGDLRLFQWWLSWDPQFLPFVIRDDNYAVLATVAAGGYLHVFQWIEETCPGLIKTSFEEGHFDSLTNAAGDGHLDLLKWLLTFASGTLQTMIQAGNLEVVIALFIEAADEGCLDVLNFLANRFPDCLQAMIQHKNYKAFRDAVTEGHLPVVLFIIALNKQMKDIRREHEQFQTANPDGVFDMIDTRRIMHCMELFRVNFEAGYQYDKELKFFLTMPSVKAFSRLTLSAAIVTHQGLFSPVPQSPTKSHEYQTQKKSLN